MPRVGPGLALACALVFSTACTTPPSSGGGSVTPPPVDTSLPVGPAPSTQELWVGGDSIPSGSVAPPSWVAELSVPAANLALGGAGLYSGPRIVDRLASHAEVYGYPDRLVVSGGVNDAQAVVPVVAVQAAADQLDDWFTARGVEVIWITPPYTTTSTYNGVLAALSAHLITEHAAVDCGSLLGLPIAPANHIDGVHLSATGDAIYGACVDAVL